MNPKLELAVEAIRALHQRTHGELVCFRWIDKEYKAKGLSQHDFQKLAAEGILQPSGEAVRGGKRRYYKLTDHPIWKQLVPQPV